MDITSFDTTTLSERGVDCELFDVRTGKKSGAVIVVRGMDSEVFHAATVESGRELARIAESGKQPTRKERDEQTCRLLAACTIGWSGLDKDGEPIAFTSDAALDLYLRYPAIREQVNRFIGDRGNFVLA